jgi:hypothetical protein
VFLLFADFGGVLAAFSHHVVCVPLRWAIRPLSPAR